MEDTDAIVLECPYEPPHTHTFPADWQFGGATGDDPRTDPRFRPNVYVYYDQTLHPLHTTVVPLCDDQAIDEFTKVAGWFPGHPPVYLAVRRPGEKETILPYEYDAATDYVKDM